MEDTSKRKRLVLSLLVGVVTTTAIFYFMATLILNSGSYLGDKDSGVAIEFLRIKNDDDLQTRKRRIPKKPDVKKPPKQPKLKVATPDAPQKPQLSMSMPHINPALNDGPFLGAAGGGGFDEVVPLVRIEPQYPHQARMNGTEGWVELQFDVTEAGTVKNVSILRSQPRRVFDSNARRAVLKWKYRPKVINGKPVVQEGLKTRFTFRIEGES